MWRKEGKLRGHEAGGGEIRTQSNKQERRVCGSEGREAKG